MNMITDFADNVSTGFKSVVNELKHLRLNSAIALASFGAPAVTTTTAVGLSTMYMLSSCDKPTVDPVNPTTPVTVDKDMIMVITSIANKQNTKLSTAIVFDANRQSSVSGLDAVIQDDASSSVVRTSYPSDGYTTKFNVKYFTNNIKQGTASNFSIASRNSTLPVMEYTAKDTTADLLNIPVISYEGSKVITTNNHIKKVVFMTDGGEGIPISGVASYKGDFQSILDGCVNNASTFTGPRILIVQPGTSPILQEYKR